MEGVSSLKSEIGNEMQFFPIESCSLSIKERENLLAFFSIT